MLAVERSSASPLQRSQERGDLASAGVTTTSYWGFLPAVGEMRYRSPWNSENTLSSTERVPGGLLRYQFPFAQRRPELPNSGDCRLAHFVMQKTAYRDQEVK